MAAKKKYKRLTNQEKKWNKEIKEEMIQKGLIPPPKPKLNRRKFAEEVTKEFKSFDIILKDTQYLSLAIGFMTATATEKWYKISEEDIGVLKLLKVAMEIKKLHEEKRSKGEKACTIGELMDAINSIKKL